MSALSLVGSAWAGPRYVAPDGYSFEVPAGYKRSVHSVAKDVAAWVAPDNSVLAVSSLPVSKDVSEKQLLYVARYRFVHEHSKAAKLLQAKSMTVQGDHGVVLLAEDTRASPPLIKLSVTEVSILHNHKFYIIGLSVPLAKRKVGVNTMSALIGSWKYK